MEKKTLELTQILEKELFYHERLLAAAQSMNAALKREAVDEVRTANKEYDECTCQIEALEEKRLCVSDEIALRLRLPAHANLLRVIGALPKEGGARLLELRNRLRSTLGALRKLNASNRILLTESLYTIAKTFEFIAAASEKVSGYKHQGEKCVSKANRTIINTVA